MMNALMKLAPLGAGGAMAFTIGRYGSARCAAGGADGQLLPDVPAVHPGGARAHRARSPASASCRFIAYIKDELLTVLGTSSSESALVPLMQKLERLGCSQSVVGLVVPSATRSISMAPTST
jgi:aerobic C4-dicarboxylate transport protein